MNMTHDQRQVRREVVRWIDGGLNENGWRPSELAKRADVAASTVCRILNNPNHSFTPSFSTLRKLSKGLGKPIPERVVNAFGISVDKLTLIEPEPIKVETKVAVAEPPKEEDDLFAEAVVATKPKVPAKTKVSDKPAPEGKVKLTYVSALPSNIQPPVHKEELVPLLPQLRSDKTAFAFRMPTAEYDPVIPMGTLMYGSRMADPIVGDMILITRADGRSLVRHLEDVTEDGLKVRALDAEVDAVIGFAEIASVGVIVGWSRG